MCNLQLYISVHIYKNHDIPYKGNLRPESERIRNSSEPLFFCVVHADEALGATCAPQRNMHLEDTFFKNHSS